MKRNLMTIGEELRYHKARSKIVRWSVVSAIAIAALAVALLSHWYPCR